MKGGVADALLAPAWTRGLLALVAGGLQALSILLPWTGEPAWWLQLVSLALLVGLVARSRRVLEAAALGFAFALAWLAGSWWWLFTSLHVYGALPAPLAVASVLALAGSLALYYATATAVAWRLGVFVQLGGSLWPGSAVWRFPLVFAAVWLLAELARGQWLTGFPWGAGGYAHVDGPLAVLAPWVGVYGIGFVAALAAAVVGQLLSPPRSGPDPATADPAHRASTRGRRLWLTVGALAMLVGALWLVPAGDRPLAPQMSQAASPLRVALLQGNIAQDEKFRPGSGIPLALDWYGRQMVGSGAQLVIAPETAIPLLPRDLPAGYLDEIAEQFRSGHRALMLGIPLGGEREGYTNSVIGLRPRADAYRYDKHHLVPFGEFIPPLFRWFTELMEIPLGDFRRGALSQPSFQWQGQRLAPNICYEDLFGEQLAVRFAVPEEAPTILVNVSNIAWFGDSVAIDQHLQISRMRALELRRPMLRATNTGATAIIDHQGRVTARLPRLTRGVLEGEVEGRSGITAFARWAGAWGLAPLWLLGLVLLAFAGFSERGIGRPPG